jgi:hypothetical protein
MGVLVWQGGLVGLPRLLLGFAVLLSPFVATTDSSFQNTYEYLAILLGLLLSKSLELRDGVFAVLGDSRSSLVEMRLVSGADHRRLRIPYERIMVYKITIPRMMSIV